ncbi:sensor histidine kinase [Sphingobium estronivorans]|uniref:sensor histidine kinase n=1 Tax=Sphingobium estronivorans TaxID=1577690 RepID=UPI0012392B5F|nr:histidine kinase [Sphingobium estronivorans]
MDRLVLWLGRSPTLGFAISRVAFAVGAIWQIDTLFGGALSVSQVLLLKAAIGAWALVNIAQPLLTPPIGLFLRPVFLLIDLLVFLSAIILCPPLENAAMGGLFFVAWSASDRFGRNAVILLGLFLAAAFLLRGHYTALHVRAADPAMDGLTVLLGCVIAASLLSASILEARLVTWSERLQGVGLSFQKSLAQFIVEQVSALMDARYCAFIWEEMDDEDVHCELSNADGTGRVTLTPGQVERLMGVTPREAPFLYSAASTHTLLRSRQGVFRHEKAEALAQAMFDLFGPGQGISVFVQAGELRGRLFVSTRHDWSPAALLRALRIQEGMDLFLERHFFFLAWRQKTFSEARHALSRDLHDSVLQTLAALRVRLATTIHELSGADVPGQLAELKSMEELVTAEQTHLRRLLSHGDTSPHATVDLAVEAERCCRFIGLQWGIDCLPNLIEKSMMVSAATAAEVEFLIREAAANAVRHADARHITVSIAQVDDEILIALKDNPGSKPAARESYTGDFELQSQSIMKRLGKIGGTAYFHNLSMNSLISIRLPTTLPRSMT